MREGWAGAVWRQRDMLLEARSVRGQLRRTACSHLRDAVPTLIANGLEEGPERVDDERTASELRAGRHAPGSKQHCWSAQPPAKRSADRESWQSGTDLGAGRCRGLAGQPRGVGRGRDRGRRGARGRRTDGRARRRRLPARQAAMERPPSRPAQLPPAMGRLARSPAAFLVACVCLLLWPRTGTLALGASPSAPGATNDVGSAPSLAHDEQLAPSVFELRERTYDLFAHGWQAYLDHAYPMVRPRCCPRSRTGARPPADQLAPRTRARAGRAQAAQLLGLGARSKPGRQRQRRLRQLLACVRCSSDYRVLAGGRWADLLELARTTACLRNRPRSDPHRRRRHARRHGRPRRLRGGRQADHRAGLVRPGRQGAGVRGGASFLAAWRCALDVRR